MRQASVEMASEYERIRRQTHEDPGTAGDQGEENWASLLSNWLPGTYEVVTKGRIIGEDGRTSPQVDVIVLKGIYPKKLLDKKLYLASGVAAAFECKTTLRPEHIEEAVETGVKVKRLFPARTGTPYRELHTPILYGLLAHSHDWKRPGSRPKENVRERLLQSDQSYVAHPRESMDLLCVADLAAWAVNKLVLPSDLLSQMQQLDDTVPRGPEYAKGIILTSFNGPVTEDVDQDETFTPIGTLITSLSRKLAWGDPSLRDLAEYYPNTGIEESGGGAARKWAASSIFSEEVYSQLTGRMRGGPWDEWSNFFS